MPIIQPPIMRALTRKEDRQITMEQLRHVSKTERVLFPIIVTVIVGFMLPSAAALVGMLMLGNLVRESGVVDRLSKTAQNELINIVTIFLGVTVGATAKASTFLTADHWHHRTRPDSSQAARRRRAPGQSMPHPGARSTC